MEKLTAIDTKVDRIQEDITEIKVTMAVNTESLKQHMNRTLHNEAMLDTLKKELTPVHEHVLKVNFLVSVLGAVGITIGVLYSITQIVTFFFK